MSYTKNTWACGDEITAEKLNHMEDGIADAPGYEYNSSSVVFYDGSVDVSGYYSNGRASSAFQLSADLLADEITVTFDGTEYTLQRQTFPGPDGDMYHYGAPFGGGFNFNVCPFCVFQVADSTARLATPSSQGGTHTLKIVGSDTVIETTEGFEKAVMKVVDENEEPEQIVRFELTDVLSKTGDVTADVAQTTDYTGADASRLYLDAVAANTAAGGNATLHSVASGQHWVDGGDVGTYFLFFARTNINDVAHLKSVCIVISYSNSSIYSAYVNDITIS